MHKVELSKLTFVVYILYLIGSFLYLFWLSYSVKQMLIQVKHLERM